MIGYRLFALWLGYLLFVIYGSLVPLDYRPMPFEQAWAAFQHIPYLNLGLESRADWVANGVLYFPLGLLSATLLMRMEGAAWRVLGLVLATGFCCAVAVGVEFTQLFFPPRTVSQNDLIAETIGSILGVMVAPILLPWIKRLSTHLVQGGVHLRHYALQAYAVGYVLLSLFPYDFLLSKTELLGKLNSSAWGWVLADGADRPALAVLQLAVEVALAVPFGFLAARRPGSGFWSGMILGLAIEGIQFFIETAVSQGLSVATRVLGVTLGVALWRRRERFDVNYCSGAIRRYGLWLAPFYLVALSVANGWAVKPWHGLAGAIAAWPAVRFMPFYYHYYSTEAHALVSLGFVSLMYMPLAVLAWAHRWPMRRILLIGGLGSLLVETSKLFLTGSRPDPTNVLIAMAACALTLEGLEVMTRTGPASPVAAPVAAPVAGRSFAGQSILLALALAGIGVEAWLFPSFAPSLVLLLLACAGLVWWRPLLALAIIPAALPVLDFAPWSGRFYWDEFDLLVLVCLLVGLVRARPATARQAPLDGLGAGFLLLALSFGASTMLALWPWQGVDADSFSNYASHFNALRIVKGGVWAWGFLLLYKRLTDHGEQRARVFSRGMQCGLALTVLFVLWERVAFVGLFDFAADYRVSGPFSAMHKGGAYIECYLAVGAAFVLGELLGARSWRARLPSALLLLAATYSVMVTYSRNGYAALALIVLVMLGWHLLAGAVKVRRIATFAGMLAVILAVAAPIASGPYARARIANSSNDLAARQAHWRDALAMRDADWTSAVLGVGVGRYPDQHFWRSNETRHAGTYSIKQEAGNQFLRLGVGTAIYMEQIVDLEPGQDYVLAARLRSSEVDAELGVALCQKWMLTAIRCTSAALKTGSKANTWQDVEIKLKTAALSDQPWYGRRPLKLALITPTQKMTLDIDNVHLDGWPAPDAVHNGNFSAGLDHWFFTTDVDPPWQIDSLPVAILFDQGWFGVLAWGMVCALALYHGVRRARKGSLPALTAMAALLGFLASGSLNTLIDAPRFLWLVLVFAWLCRDDDHRPLARSAPMPQG
ncbi:MAG: VanZ family protein [Pseudomonadota bacterium]